jgi:hypothetical protein
MIHRGVPSSIESVVESPRDCTTLHEARRTERKRKELCVANSAVDESKILPPKDLDSVTNARGFFRNAIYPYYENTTEHGNNRRRLPRV